MEAVIEYPKYHKLSKREIYKQILDKDMESMERRMAENEHRNKEVLKKLKEDDVNGSQTDDDKLPSLEWYSAAQKPFNNKLDTNILSSSPTKSDIELREMLRNPQPPKTPTLLDYLSDLCSETDDSTIRTMSLKKPDTESESLDTLLTRDGAWNENPRSNKSLVNENGSNPDERNYSNNRDIKNSSHSLFLPIKSGSSESVCQNSNEMNICKSSNISLSRKLLERNLEKLIQEHRISGHELISQLTNEMTESQLEHLRRITDIELSDTSDHLNRNNLNTNQQPTIQAFSRHGMKKDPECFSKGCCQDNQFSSCLKLESNIENTDECFRSPAIPRKTPAQNMIQSSYNVTPELFISRCCNKRTKSKSSRNYVTMGHTNDRVHPVDPTLYHKGYTRNRDIRDWTKSSECFGHQNNITPERPRTVKIAHRSHSYRQSTNNDRLLSTVTRAPKDKRRRSGNFFQQLPIPKRNEGIQYYSPQLEKKCSNYFKASTSNQPSKWKACTSSNTGSYFTDTYPVSNDYDYCSSCSSTSTSSSSSSSEDNEDDRRLPRTLAENVIDKRMLLSRSKRRYDMETPLPYYGGVRASYLPNDRKRLLKQKKMTEELFRRDTKCNDNGLAQRHGFNAHGSTVDINVGQPLLRQRGLDQPRARMHRPMSEHFLSSDVGCNASSRGEGFVKATYEEEKGNKSFLVKTESGTHIKRFRQKELKNKNCIVS